MNSLSLFTGPMALLTAATSASDIFALQAPKTPAHTTTTASSPSQPPAKMQSADASTSPSGIPSPPANMTTTTTTTTTTTHLPLSLRSPTADLVWRCHSSATHAWTLAATAAKPVAWAAHHSARLLLILATALATTVQLYAARCGQTAWQVCWWYLWACKPATRMRKKVYFEVALAAMGPSGNGLLLVMLWPGWLVLAAAVWGLSAALTVGGA